MPVLSRSPYPIVLGTLVTLVGATVVGATGGSSLAAASATVVRVGSDTPGREVRVRGVLLILGQSMQAVEQAPPFEFRSGGKLVFAALSPAGVEAMLRLELVSDTPEPAVVIAPRVMVGHRIGGVATEFAQGC
jgi:hypothetical protein